MYVEKIKNPHVCRVSARCARDIIFECIDLSSYHSRIRATLHTLSPVMPPPAVLLCGARRSGKCATVAVVARALGCHLLELNAFQLVGDTEVWHHAKHARVGVTLGEIKWLYITSLG
jgi:hypothetical protein